MRSGPSGPDAMKCSDNRKGKDRAVLDVRAGIRRVAVQDGIADGRDVLFFGMDAPGSELLFNLGKESLAGDLQIAENLFVVEYIHGFLALLLIAVEEDKGVLLFHRDSPSKSIR